MIRFAGKDSAGIVYVSSSLSSSLFFYIYISLSFGIMQPYGTLAALTAVFFHGSSNSDGALTERALEIRSAPCSPIKTGEGRKKNIKIIVIIIIIIMKI